MVNFTERRRLVLFILVFLFFLQLSQINGPQSHVIYETTEQKKQQRKISSCPDGFVYMEDQISSSLVTEETTNITDDDDEHKYTIPKLVHVLIETKCITKNLQESLFRNWHLALSDHSIIYHDKEEIDVFISEIAKSRHDFSGILAVYYCTSNVSIKMDIARLMYLWKFGGLSVVAVGHPFNSIPTPAFVNGTAVDYNADEFLWWFEQINESSDTAQQQLLASAPEHPALYIAIIHFIAEIDIISNCLETDVSGNCDYLYPGFLHNLYANKIMKYYTEDKNANNNEGKTRMINIASYLKSTITHIKDQSDRLLVHSDMKNNSNLLATDVFDDDRSTKQQYFQCNTMPQKRMINYKKSTTHNDVKDPSLSLFDVNVEFLLEIVDLKHQNETKCPDGLIHIPSTYNPGSIESNNEKKAKEGNGDKVRRHIPKFIHMTSKTRCFSPEFVENINKWRNFEGYSFFIHDDNAVKRLFSSSDYSQKFPLLNEILLCVNSGAGLADVWRYLAIWEFGGIYTDIDNAPGSSFANGSVIEDYMDSFFEQEMGRFPSQYFFASAPRTPVMYMTLKSTIERLLDTESIQNQYVPFVTGPGAVKTGVIRTIGNGYPTAGEYEGLGGRNVTIVGSPQMARRGHFVIRDSIRNKGPKLVKMNMKKYGRRNGNKTNSCLREIMENTETKTHN